MVNPFWLTEARKYLNIEEIKGIEHEPEILKMWDDIKLGGVNDDETPWCAAFVGAVLERVGLQSTRSGWARSYLDWGYELDDPQLGCVVVFARGAKSGHVGFVVGRDARGWLHVLGGNQGDAVNVKLFDPARVLGYRYPKLLKRPDVLQYPVPMFSGGSISTNEA